MGQAVTPEYDISEAVKAFDRDYAKDDVPIGSDDSLDLSTPLNDARLLAVGRRQNAALSLVFDSEGEKCDVLMVLWGINKAGAKVAIGHFRVDGVEAISGKAPTLGGDFFAETVLFDTGAVRFVEFRLISVSGTINKVKAWTY